MANPIRKTAWRKMPQTPDEVLFIFGAVQTPGRPPSASNSVEADMRRGESVLLRHLRDLGYKVEATDDASFQPTDSNDKALIILSSTVKSMQVGMALRLAEIPIITSTGTMFATLGMTGPLAGRDYGFVPHNATARISVESHQMTARLNGKTFPLSGDASYSYSGRPLEEAVERAQEFVERWTSGERALKGGEPEAEEAAQSGRVLIWGRPGEGAIEIATLENLDEKVLVFGYELCSQMFGLHAPARRVGLFLDQGVVTGLTSAGWALFDAAVDWAIGDEAKEFTQIYREEWGEIQQRRKNSCPQSPSDANPCQPPKNLVGLALSGGGIRSATFCLGLLQGLKELELLH